MHAVTDLREGLGGVRPRANVSVMRLLWHPLLVRRLTASVRGLLVARPSVRAGEPEGPPPVPGRGGVIGWALYDWANSSVATVIMTFVFAAYFTRQVAPDPETGTVWWGMANASAGALVALFGPVLGAAADQGGHRKAWIGAFTLLGVVATAALWVVAPDPAWMPAAAVLIGLGAVGTDAAIIFYNAMLPGLVGLDRVDRWSGLGWALGYAGGLVCLVLVLVLFILPSPPLFGLDPATAEPVRAAAVLVAVWFGVFSLPLLLLTPDRDGGAAAGIPLGRALRDGAGQLIDTLRHVRRYAGLVRFLVARMLYIDALATVFVFGGVFAAGTFALTEGEVLVFGIGLNVTAAIGAVTASVFGQRLGSRRTILVSLVGLALPGIVMLVAGSEPWTAVFGPAAAPWEVGLLTLDRDRLWFWGAGLVLGFFVGPVQAASRAYMAQAAPERLRTQMFGLYTLSGKATAFLGPLLVGWVSYAAGSQRWGMSTLVVLFGLGFAVMLTVPPPDEARQRGAP